MALPTPVDLDFLPTTRTSPLLPTISIATIGMLRPPDNGDLSSISIVSHDRPDATAAGVRRRNVRGVRTSALEAGVSAETSIREAQDQTRHYRAELDTTRVLLGRATDAVREHEQYIAARGLASERSFAFTLPPDPVTAEILKRDATIASWSGAYRTATEAAACARNQYDAERARLLSIVGDQKDTIQAASDAARSAAAQWSLDLAAVEKRHAITLAESDARHAAALAEVPAPIEAELAALRKEVADLAPCLAECQDAKAKAEHTAEAFRKDIHYYIHQTQKATQRELDVTRTGLEQQQQNVLLQAQLLQVQHTLAGLTGLGTISSAPVTHVHAEGDDALEHAFDGFPGWPGLDGNHTPLPPSQAPSRGQLSPRESQTSFVSSRATSPAATFAATRLGRTRSPSSSSDHDSTGGPRRRF